MRRFLLLIAVLAATSVSLSAAPVFYQIGSFSDDGFTASVLHRADSGHIGLPDGSHWYTNGGHLADISGVLKGDITDGGLTFEASTLSILFLDGPLGAYNLNILGGELNIDTGDASGGFLDYRISTPDDSVVYSEGTFNFPKYDLGVPNSVTEDGLFLWGMNFLDNGYDHDYGDNGRGFKDEFLSLGIDLYGAPAPVPEPATMAMMGIGLAAAGLARRRRRNAETTIS